MAALGIRLRSLLTFSLVARWFVARHCRKICAPSIVEAQKGPYSSKARFWHPPPCGFPLPVLSGSYIRSQAYSAVAPMKVIRDPENWERTGLYRLAIRDRDCRHPVWTQAGSDAQSVGSAGPGLPPLAAFAGEKKKPQPDWTVRRFRSQDGVSLIGLSARVSVSLSDVPRPPLCRASLQGVTPHSGYRSDVWGRFFPPE